MQKLAAFMGAPFGYCANPTENPSVVQSHYVNDEYQHSGRYYSSTNSIVITCIQLDSCSGQCNGLRYYVIRSF